MAFGSSRELHVRVLIEKAEDRIPHGYEWLVDTGTVCREGRAADQKGAELAVLRCMDDILTETR